MADAIRKYTVPGAVTVSRQTGEIIGVETVEATEAEFLQYCSWVLRVHGLDEIAEGITERIREKQLRQTG